MFTTISYAFSPALKKSLYVTLVKIWTSRGDPLLLSPLLKHTTHCFTVLTSTVICHCSASVDECQYSSISSYHLLRGQDNRQMFHTGASIFMYEDKINFDYFLIACPSYPHGITLLNCDGHSMTLGWKAPKYSGGSPILGYYIDKREANHKNWHEVNSSVISRTIYTVGTF